jgi:DNA-binding helix-hairpin-helix protein with protein kinase domain
MMAAVSGGGLLLCVFCLNGLASAALILFLLAAGWWLYLRWRRKAKEREANRAYDAQHATWRAAVARERQEWQRQLAAKQAEARRRHGEELHRWQAAVNALRQEARRRRNGRDEARQRVYAAEQNWTAAAGRIGIEFDRQKNRLRKLRKRGEELDREYAEECRALRDRAQAAQREQFLRQHLIRDALIPDIGPTRRAMLASFGIETAFDVKADVIQQVPGFGPKFTQRLLNWRQQVEGRYAYNPAAGVPLHEQQALDARHARATQPVEEEMLSGEARLRAIAVQGGGQLQQFLQHIQLCLEQLTQAELDLSLIPPGI